MTIIEEIADQPPALVGEDAEASDLDVEDGTTYSRGEKKARKALSKLGLKKLPEIHRVTFKRAKNVCFI